MWNLESIRLVHFFLFDAQEVRLQEVTGIFGPNGSGKSTLLDAVQIAMMGANSRHIALNAQADDKSSTRSIRGYCLGQFGEGPDQRARDSALTYITLIWRNTETRQPVSMGVCIQASADTDGHDVLGRYVVRDVELSLGDHLQSVDGQERPRDWPSFRLQLQQRAKVSGDDPLQPDSERYIRAALMALRSAAGVPSVDAFTRAFRFALRMRFDRHVDGIVRHDVLEARPTKVEKFREITDSFRRLSQLVKEIEEKISGGTAVEALYSKALHHAREAKTWEVLEQDVKENAAMTLLNNATERVQAADEAQVEFQRKETELRQDVAAAESNLQRMIELRNSHASHQTHGQLQSNLTAANRNAEEKGRQILGSLRVVAATLSEAAEAPSLTESASELKQHAGAVKALDDLETITRQALDQVLRPALKASDKAFESAMAASSDIARQLREAEQRKRTAEAGFERAREGKVPLSESVQRLKTALADEGIQADAVCDLVRIADASWQSSIESFLGPNLEALLVRDHQEKDAFRVYRGLKGAQAVYGVKLVIEGKQRQTGAPDRHSIAELIQGENSAAVAFLRRQFGLCKQADRDEEALAGNYTITRDGMLNKAGEIERLRPVNVEKFRIGAGGGAQRQALQNEVNRLKAEIQKITEKHNALARIVQKLRIVGGADKTMQSILADWNEFQGAKESAKTFLATLSTEADQEYVRLGQEIETQGQAVTTLRAESAELAKRAGAAEHELKKAREARQTAEVAHELEREKSEQLRTDPDFDGEDVPKKWDALLEEFPGDYAGMQGRCSERHRQAAKHYENAAGSGNQKLGAFLLQYREQMPPNTENDWRASHAWVRDYVKHLHDTDLLKHKSQMDEAYRTSQETFRTDVAIALSNNLDWLDATMQRLNGVLSTCPVFSNGERYKFIRHVRPALRSLLEFIKNVAAYGPTEDLLGGPGQFPEEFKALLEEKVIIGGAGGTSPLDDYREFYEFDVEILREDPVTKASKHIGHLSKRLGPGSGGEHRAPLYVIAGAALSSAYRIDRGVVDGMRLILLDEAFNKMDMNNIIATMQYFEGLGLQVFMASPGENHGILSAFLHRYYDILRDADNNALMLQGHDLTEEARAYLRADLAEFNPELIEEEMAAMRAQSVARVSQAA